MAKNISDKVNKAYKWIDNVSIHPLISKFNKFVGLQKSQFYFRKKKYSKEKICFTNFLSSSKNILIILPVNYDLAIASLKFILEMEDKFAQKNITIIDSKGTSIGSKDSLYQQTIHYTQNDVSKYGIPKEVFLRKIKKRTYDIAIDLNLFFDLTSSFICRESDAKIRIGIKHKYSDLFFNFQIGVQNFSFPQNEKIISKTYDIFTNSLKMF